MDPIAAAWTEADIAPLAATPKAFAEAKKLAAGDAFGPVERGGDGRTWAADCRGSQGTYRVTVHVAPRATRPTATCRCLSRHFPCKHGLALMLRVVADPTLSAAPAGPGGDFEALLRAVFHQPDDDTPRLVFADYLDDHGEADRAAFIRLQCRLARMTPRDRGKRELRKQEKAAIAAFGLLVATPYSPAPDLAVCERGFLRLPVRLWYTSTELPPQTISLLRAGWVETIIPIGTGTIPPGVMEGLLLAGTIDARKFPVSETALLALARATADGTARTARALLRPSDQKLLNHLRDGKGGAPVRGGSVNRIYEGVTAADLHALVRAGRLDGVRNLTLEGAIGDDGAAALASTPTVSSVRELVLRGTRIGPAGGAALAAADYLSGVDALYLMGQALDDGFAALCAGGGFPGLKTLRVDGGRIGDAAAVALGRATHFARLENMLWNSTDLTPAGAAAVLASPHLPNLTTVNLHGNPFTPDSLFPLACGAADRRELTLLFPGVEIVRSAAAGGFALTVDCHENWGGRKAAELIDGFARAKGAKRVVALTLRGVHVAPEAARALARALDPKALTTLAFIGCRLGNAGAAAVAAAFAAFRPTHFTLTVDSVRRTGAEALAGSALLTAVTDLNLSDNPLAVAGVTAFAARAAGLTTFEVRGTGLDGNDRRKLRKTFPGLRG